MLLERGPELQRMRQAIRKAAGGAGGLAVIGGPAGIGKTALLGAATDMAQEAGLRVLRARGSDLEQEFAFGWCASCSRRRWHSRTQESVRRS
jgi:hypothetical protein